MTRPSLGSEVLLAIAAFLVGCSSTPRTPAIGPTGPNRVLSFEGDTASACWSPWHVEMGAHTGKGALYLRSRDEYVPLVRTSIGAIGEVPEGVVVSCWMRTEGRAGRLRLFVHTVPEKGSAQRFYSRIIRPGELPADTWCDVHAQVLLDGLHAAPDDGIEVVLWNEGGSAMTVDDARVTFTANAISGSTPGTPFDVDSLTDGHLPDGRAPSARFASPLTDTVR